MVDDVLESMQRHTLYLDKILVPLALLDQDISAEDREAMANQLYSFPVPKTFQHSQEKWIYFQSLISLAIVHQACCP